MGVCNDRSSLEMIFMYNGRQIKNTNFLLKIQSFTLQGEVCSDFVNLRYEGVPQYTMSGNCEYKRETAESTSFLESI